MEKKHKEATSPPGRQQADKHHIRPSLEVDFEKYAHFLEDSDLTEDQKRELLQAIWTIIIGFVDLGFGVHPVQQACGQVEDPVRKTEPDSPQALYSSQRSIIEKFVSESERHKERAKEGAEA